MASISVAKASGAGTGALLIACVAEHGSAAHPCFVSEALLSGPDSARNLADAVHFLCALHGRHPASSISPRAAPEPAARAWLTAAGEAWRSSGSTLTRLAVAAGPVPSTPEAVAAKAPSSPSTARWRRSPSPTARAARSAHRFGLRRRLGPGPHPARRRRPAGRDRAPPCRLGEEAGLRPIADAAGEVAARARHAVRRPAALAPAISASGTCSRRATRPGSAYPRPRAARYTTPILTPAPESGAVAGAVRRASDLTLQECQAACIEGVGLLEEGRVRRLLEYLELGVRDSAHQWFRKRVEVITSLAPNVMWVGALILGSSARASWAMTALA